MTATPPPERLAAERLAGLVLLMARARNAESPAQIGHLLVNDSAALSPYRNAVLWRHGMVAAVSGLAVPVQEAPFTHWIAPLCTHLGAACSTQPVIVDPAALPEDVRRQWPDFLPASALWLPLSAGPEGLLLARDEPWAEAELPLLQQWAGAGGHALNALEPRHWRQPLRRFWQDRPRLWRYGAAALLALTLPVRLTVLAPADIAPLDPVVVRAPLAGVVAEILVQPNAAVTTGTPLARLESREFESRLLVVRQGLETALAQLRLSYQSGIVDNKASADAAIAKAQVAEREAEVAQVEELLSRVAINAETNGLALFADAASLVGRPVRLGEKLMMLADPAKVEIDVWIPVADNAGFGPGDAVELFLNVAPERAVRGTLRSVTYQPAPTPEGSIAFRAVATLDAGETPPRIGLRGTAKVFGPSVSLGYLLFRRPVAALRQALGL